eukprot:3252207-Lingulodinium_polyedra.AAC.1
MPRLSRRRWTFSPSRPRGIKKLSRSVGHGAVGTQHWVAGGCTEASGGGGQATEAQGERG